MEKAVSVSRAGFLIGSPGRAVFEPEIVASNLDLLTKEPMRMRLSSIYELRALLYAA